VTTSLLVSTSAASRPNDATLSCFDNKLPLVHWWNSVHRLSNSRGIVRHLSSQKLNHLVTFVCPYSVLLKCAKRSYPHKHTNTIILAIYLAMSIEQQRTDSKSLRDSSAYRQKYSFGYSTQYLYFFHLCLVVCIILMSIHLQHQKSQPLNLHRV